MSNSDIVEILEDWRAALREADAAPLGTPERSAAEARAEARRREYRAAALRLKGHIDQVEGRIEETAERLRISILTIDSALQTDDLEHDP